MSKKWERLTHEDVDELLELQYGDNFGTFDFIRWIEERLYKLNEENLHDY